MVKVILVLLAFEEPVLGFEDITKYYIVIWKYFCNCCYMATSIYY